MNSLKLGQNKNILLCVTGGIAAYKAIDLASMLQKSGYSVRTVLTEAARQFVSPLNFAAITHNSVHESLWTDADPIPHITLADWADLIVVAPATANALAKAAHGIADDLLSTLLLAHQKPILWVPAMNVHMFENPVTQKNLALLKERGDHILSPAKGMLACGYEGQGKYPPNLEVQHAIACYLEHSEDLQGKKVLVTAGGTSEAIDPMRTIGNRSSGKMGIALARALALRGAEVSLVYANISVEVPYLVREAIKVITAAEMREAVLRLAPAMDWIIKCAAVSDYKPAISNPQKIKKGENLTLNLVPTVDILAELGRKKPSGQIIVGFAAETQDLLAHAQSKLTAKNLDLIVANHLDNAALDTNQIYIIGTQGAVSEDPLSGTKSELAHLIIDRVKAL
jgi:phosphopantothenoylcysteine decarboxylase / phosphopantothenate---cysteine ligase